MSFNKLVTLEKQKVIAKWVIFFGKTFILLSVLFLSYLLWTVREGYSATPEDKFATGQKVIPFQLLPGYSISFASNGFFSKIVILDNSSTQQRIVIHRVYFRKERKPEGFLNKFNHPDETISLNQSTFTGLKNPLITVYGEFTTGSMNIPYALLESNNPSGQKKGGIYCLYCPQLDKSYFMESAAPDSSFSEKDTRDFISNLSPCK